jgi:hypothetical protein
MPIKAQLKHYFEENIKTSGISLLKHEELTFYAKVRWF